METSNKNDSRVVALYIRTSTFLQTGGLSSQQMSLKKYCQQNEITNYIIYQDEGISGAKDSRPALDRMLNDVKKN